MEKNKLIYIIIICTVFLQNYFYSSTELNPNFTFALGIDGLDIKFNLVSSFLLLLPIFMIVFIFNDNLYQLIHKDGKLYVVRNCSKTNLVLKMLLNILLEVIAITLFEVAVYCILQGKLYDLSTVEIIKALFIYINAVFSIGLLEIVLQFYFNPAYVTLITNIFIFISCTFGIVAKSQVIKILLFPSLTFGLYNGSVAQNDSYIFNLLLFHLIEVILTSVTVFKFKKSDIF